MDDTTALQECGDLSLEIDELSPATQMFLSSSPSLQSHNWESVTPTLSSSIAYVQPPIQPLPPATRRSRNEQSATRMSSSGGAHANKHTEKGPATARNALDRGKSASKSKTPSGALKMRSSALAVAEDAHRDSAEFFEKPNGGLLASPPAFDSSDFLLLPADDMAKGTYSLAQAAPVYTPQKIEAKLTGRNSKLLRPSPNVSLFSGNKRNGRSDALADASPNPLHSSVDIASRTYDLAAALQIGPGKPVPAPPAPTHCAKEQPHGLSNAFSSDMEFLQIQQFLAQR